MISTLGTIDNPIRCDAPIGERRYLHQLVSETHGFIRYKRMGSFRVDGNILDGYAIMDLAGEKFVELYFDMYHPGHVEESIPSGFTRIDSEMLSDQVLSTMLDRPSIPSDLQEQIIISDRNHGYVEAKAQRLLLCGPLYYHTHDYFGHPRLHWNWIGILDASRQILEDFSGRLESNPIKVVDASIANQLLQTFHFDPNNSALIDSTVEPVLVCGTHTVTAETLQFWFQRSTLEVENPSELSVS